MKYVDVSQWQGEIDWQKVRNAGIAGCVIKVTNKNDNPEKMFEKNYAGAKEAGLPICVYNYLYANTVETAVKSAQGVLKTLNGRKLQGKVWLDIEDANLKNIGARMPKIINAYKEVITLAGYDFGVYTGLSFYNSFIKPYATQIHCDFWIARYPSSKRMTASDAPNPKSKPSIVHNLWGWQYSSKGLIDGIVGNVDLSEVYASNNGVVVKQGNPYCEPNYTLYKGRFGMKKEHVMWLQFELNELGHCLAVDGIFGKKTDDALRAVQRLFNLEIDGQCGTITRTLLKSV